MTDPSAVLHEGPWRHRFVAANGSRFHVAEAAPEADDGAPLVVLLHGFPQMWWAWRHQLPALAAAGFRAAAMDLRGTGASDKPPHGYDIPTLTRDVAGVIRSLGAHEAVVVGHGMGGAVAWSMPALQPSVTRAVGALGMPHPLRMRSLGAALQMLRQPAGLRLLRAQLPWFPERALTHGDLSTRVLADWGAPGWLDDDVAERYREAMQVPFAAHSVMEILRWALRSAPRGTGRRYVAALRATGVPDVPVLQVHGRRDRCIPETLAAAPPGSPYRYEVVEDAGHWVHEESPGATNALLVDWLTETVADRP